MANIKPIDQSSDKWSRRAGVAGEDYRMGVESPRRAWGEAAVAGESNYKDGVTRAAAAGRYGKGVRAAGDAKWRRGAIEKGVSRFGEGVRLAVDEWKKGFSPYQSAISAISLPPRGPAGDAKNLQRVAAIAAALRSLKEKGV